MKKRTGRQKLAIVTLTAMLCNFQLSSMLWTWAAESNTSSLKSQISSPSNSSVIGDVLDNKEGAAEKDERNTAVALAEETAENANIEYTEDGQTIFYLDKGSIRIEPNIKEERPSKVQGYDKDGNLITEANEKGYYITVSEKDIDTSKQKIEIHDGSNIWLDNVNGGSLNYWDIGKEGTLSIIGEVSLDGTISSFSKIQGIGDDAILHCQTLGNLIFEGKVSNLIIHSEKIYNVNIFENCKVYTDEILIQNLVAINSNITAKKHINAGFGKIQNSEINTPAFQVEPGYGGKLKNADDWWRSYLFTCENSNISCESFSLVSWDGKFFNSAIKANGLHLNSNEIPVWVSGNGPNEVYNYIEHDMNVEFDNCNINIHNEPINPEESIRGLYVIGGEYNYSTKDYDFTTPCTLTLKNNSEVSIEGALTLMDFATVNIDNSTVTIDAITSGKNYAAVKGFNGNFQKGIYPQINLSDNVMITDNKQLTWFSGDYYYYNEWYLIAIAPGDKIPATELKIIPVQLSSLQENLKNTITTANEQLKAVSIFDGDIAQFENNKPFIHSKDAELLQNAIKTAEATLSRPESTANDFENAAKNLQQAIETMKKAIKTGTKTTSSTASSSNTTTSNGNSSNRGSSRGGSSRSSLSSRTSVAYPVLSGLNPSINNGEWINENGKWRLKRADGQWAVKQWALLNNQWYLFDSSGYMLTGWALADEKWYYLSPDGTMTTGWIQVNEKWYYLNPDGVMVTGWIQLIDKWYYLSSDGSMSASTTTPDGYSVGADGAWIS